jgi:hypothetical protein
LHAVDESPSSSNFPLAQGKQFVPAPWAYDPVGQDTQLVAASASSSKKPAMQSVHPMDPAAAYFPVVHGMQDVEATDALYFPAAQSTQPSAKVAAALFRSFVPLGQSSQLRRSSLV